MPQPQVNLQVVEGLLTVDCFLNTAEDPVLPKGATEENLDLMEKFPGIQTAENVDDKRVRLVFKYDNADEMQKNFQHDASWAARFLIGD